MDGYISNCTRPGEAGCIVNTPTADIAGLNMWQPIALMHLLAFEQGIADSETAGSVSYLDNFFE